MAEGFDYQAYRAEQSGANMDKALLVTFEYASEKQPNGAHKNVEMVRIWMGKNDEIVRKVTEEDKVRFAERYAAFKRGEEVPPDGIPIKEVPFAMPADVAMCKAERILTLEQLVETPDERLKRSPGGGLMNLKYKAKDYLDAVHRSERVMETSQKIKKLEELNATKDERIARLEARLAQLESGESLKSMSELEQMDMPTLRAYCEQHGVKAHTSKATTYERLQEAGKVA